VIQPHLGKKHRITPEKLLPLPWDKKTAKKDAPKLTPEQHRERMKELVERLGDVLV